MLYFFDIFGTFVFAVTGGYKAARHELDLLGVLVLAVATGVGGGVVRDIILGATPPAAFHDELYLIVSLAGGLAIFFAGGRIVPRWRIVMWADAVGLGVFTAIGCAKGGLYGLGPIGIVMMGVLTATGGGAIRDMLVREVPAVIRKDFYATAALLGGMIMLACQKAGLGPDVQMMIGAGFTTGTRLLAMRMGIGLPRVRRLGPDEDDGPWPGNPG